MSGSAIHDDWIDKYRSKDNVNFFKLVISYILSLLKVKKNAKILEVGCGTCTKSIILAEHGYNPVAADLSEVVLKRAEANIMASGMQDNISLKCENILSLTYEDESFDYILCWGVLMHIPDLEMAVSELSRVLKKDGVIIIAENNMFSLQSLLFKAVKFLMRKDNKNVKITQAGKESWSDTDEGALLVREMDLRWFKNKLTSSGFSVERHMSGQFWELYTLFSSPIIKKMIHAFNYWWFKYIKTHHLALGNIIIFRKKI